MFYLLLAFLGIGFLWVIIWIHRKKGSYSRLNLAEKKSSLKQLWTLYGLTIVSIAMAILLRDATVFSLIFGIGLVAFGLLFLKEPVSVNEMFIPLYIIPKGRWAKLHHMVFIIYGILLLTFALFMYFIRLQRPYLPH